MRDRYLFICQLFVCIMIFNMTSYLKYNVITMELNLCIYLYYNVDIVPAKELQVKHQKNRFFTYILDSIAYKSNNVGIKIVHSQNRYNISPPQPVV